MLSSKTRYLEYLAKQKAASDPQKPAQQNELPAPEPSTEVRIERLLKRIA
jgi:hypothetical protein